MTSCGFLYWPPTAAKGSFFDEGGSQCYLWIDYNCGDLGLTNDLHVPSSQFEMGYDFFLRSNCFVVVALIMLYHELEKRAQPLEAIVFDTS